MTPEFQLKRFALQKDLTWKCITVSTFSFQPNDQSELKLLEKLILQIQINQGFLA